MSAKFFDTVRHGLGPLSQSQVDGINVILQFSKGLVIPHRAYMLATSWWETARTMQPIAEYGKGKGRPYGKPDPKTGKIYYGRGYVQLTWLKNYQKASAVTGLDLVNDPDLAMRPDVAARIMVDGMVNGWFTGKKLSDFTDYRNMRRIINGTDKAMEIAGFAKVFEMALNADAVPETVSETTPVEAPVITPVSDEPITTETKPILQHRRVWSGITGWLTSGGATAFAMFNGFEWKTLLVAMVFVTAWGLFFWFMYRKEIAAGMFGAKE